MPQSPDATVVAVGPGRATVSVDTAAVCKRCASGRGCGAGLLATRRGPQVMEVRVGSGLVLDVGDRVQLTLPPAELLRAAWLAYGLPLIAFVLATLLASRIEPGHDAVTALSAAAGVAAGLWLGRRALRRQGCLQQFIPEATARSLRRPDAGI
jgi:sigma-E factor negative regulatory protein RseC